MSKTKTYRVGLKVKQLILENTFILSEPPGYLCHREGKDVYVYGRQYGTKLTIDQARKYLEYKENQPVYGWSFIFKKVEIHPLKSIQFFNLNQFNSDV